ncbi:MAG: type II toxin-antitoxin system VapC family toxin [Spirochaetaceae bacterium]|nr:type II toxin-antitoxin system VapC family toxin [Spirochaetaceae bacterium]
MNGIDFIADTNALLYIFKKNSCMLPYLQSAIGISIITEMELLSFNGISPEEENFFKRMIDKCTVIPLNNIVKDQAIHIRRTYGTKLPDSIVAATSLECAVPLITADKGFKKILELDIRLLEPDAQ